MSDQEIQNEIDQLDSDIEALETSASGVLDYFGTPTLNDYNDVWVRAMREVNERIEELEEDIIEASGHLRVLKNGILFHSH